MPYAPGISYDTQSIASGINSAGQSLQEGIKAYAQNKRLDATATGQIEAYLKQASQTGGVQLSPNSQKLAEKLTQGKATLNDKLTLLGSLQTEGQLKTEEQQRKTREAQMQQEQQKTQQMQLAAMADAQARAKLGQLSQYMGGVGTGVLNPQAQQRLQAQAANPVSADAAQIYGATQQVPSPEVLAQMRGSELASGRRPAVDPDRIRSMDAQGNPVEITIDKLTGKELGRGPVQRPYMSPAEEGQKEAAISDARAKTADAYKVLSDVSETAEASRATLGTIDRIMSLYDQGVTSGFGQPILTQAKAMFGRAGLENVELANQQQFEKELNHLAIESRKALMKGTGQVSDYETKSVERAVANPNLSPMANRQILGVLKNIAARNVKLDELRSQLEDRGTSSVEIARQVRRMRDAIPIGIEMLADLGEKSAGAAKPPPGWKLVK